MSPVRSQFSRKVLKVSVGLLWYSSMLIGPLMKSMPGLELVVMSRPSVSQILRRLVSDAVIGQVIVGCLHGFIGRQYATYRARLVKLRESEGGDPTCLCHTVDLDDACVWVEHANSLILHAGRHGSTTTPDKTN
jgi:hypothetical protein